LKKTEYTKGNTNLASTSASHAQSPRQAVLYERRILYHSQCPPCGRTRKLILPGWWRNVWLFIEVSPSGSRPNQCCCSPASIYKSTAMQASSDEHRISIYCLLTFWILSIHSRLASYT